MCCQAAGGRRWAAASEWVLLGLGLLSFLRFFSFLHAAEMDALKNRKHWYKMDVHILLDMVVHH
jgi:hypothetical protein